VHLHPRQVAQRGAGADVCERDLEGLEGHLDDEADVELEAWHGVNLCQHGEDACDHGVGGLEHLWHKRSNTATYCERLATVKRRDEHEQVHE
jgi:hypothetical protein